jgi:adenylate kinase
MTGFPATLLQARVFDEWLDARGEALDAVYASGDCPPEIAAHYRDLGLLAAFPPPFLPGGEPPSP